MVRTIESFAESIGANKVVLALSMARMGDAIGNSILFIIIPCMWHHFLPHSSRFQNLSGLVY